MSQKIVLDFQGFKDANNMFIIKELAGFDGIKCFHTVFEPPYPLSALPRDLQLTSRWLSQNYHNINWEEGFTPYSQIGNVFRKLTASYQIIYIKGKEKCAFLRNLTNYPIVELPEHPPLQRSNPNCIFHNNKICMCALTNVKELYNIFLNESK